MVLINLKKNEVRQYIKDRFKKKKVYYVHN